MNALKNLFLDELADRYDAEKQTLKAMPRMIKAATCRHFQELIQSHLKETAEHVKKLETVFKSFGAKVKGKKCDAMSGLLKEGDKIIADFKGTVAMTAALISVAQKIEHYEIASYGSLREWARLLGNQEAANSLQNVLSEEEAANKALMALANSRSNKEAALGGNGSNSFGNSLNGRRSMKPIKLKTSRAIIL